MQLPEHASESFGDDLLQARMIVGDNEFDALQATGFQGFQELLPARSALSVGEFNREHLAQALLVDPDRDQHRLAGNASQ